MAEQMTEQRRATLRALCDTVVPSIERAEDPTGLWGRKATDIGVDLAIEEALPTLPADQLDGLFQLLDGLAAQGMAGLSQPSREQLLRNTMYLGSTNAVGVRSFIATILFIAYGLPDPETGTNPFWSALEYPGPPPVETNTERLISPLVPEQDEITLEADVCVVGSGSGGGVIAGVVAKAGQKVVVLEAGAYAEDSDFTGYELPSFRDYYWRGGPTPTLDRNVNLYAGAALGGGSTINWTNSLRTTDWVRDEWAREHGLEGVDGPDYDRHLDIVLERLQTNDECSDLNGPHQRMCEGADALGWSWKKTHRNTDPASYDPESAGHLGFGDRSGSKQSTAKTWLVDAAEHGADILVHTHAQRVLVENGRAAGVEATFSDPASGRSSKVTVRAPQVVVACGSLESPALLKRSGIGGPAVGKHLRLHPCTAVVGNYGSDQRGWWGAPQAAVVHEHENVEDGFGYLVESVQYATGVGASATPWHSAAQHKDIMSRYSGNVSLIGLVRDRGGGEVIVDEDGQPQALYSITDELDLRNSHRAIEGVVRLHVAAGAREIFGFCASLPRWQAGDDVDAFIERLKQIHLGAGGWTLFSAHQMGSCRMGTDPADSVAGPWGELHDTPGVWIGDASAFPTSSGTNPMTTIMALSHRTAEAIAAAAGTGQTKTKAEVAL